MTRVVGFIPFATGRSADELALLDRVRGRGVSMTVVVCDGVFSDCDLHRHPRPANACLLCQADVAGLLAKWHMPYRWLSRWLMPEDFTKAAQWAGGLPPQALADATYDSWQIGAWVAESARAHTSEAFASYLNSGLLAALALGRLYDEEKPETLVTFDGHTAATRVAAEIARARGMRVVCDGQGAAELGGALDR